VEKYSTAGQVTDKKIWRIHIAGWIPKATNAHSEYVILFALPRQHLHERASVSLYTYIVCKKM
jgi:hypothetical protein